MNRHTENPLQNISKRFKKLLLAFLSLGLLHLGAYACIGGGGGPGGPGAPGGGGISPVGGLGSGGMGAPPLAIPAPEALNMTAIIVAAPDTGGNSTVTVSPGAGPAGDFIVVRNRGDIVALAPWRRLLLGRAYAAGQTVTRLILPGGDTFTIGAAAGEELEFFHCLKNDINRCSQGFLISVPATGTTQGDTSKPATPPSGGVLKSITTDPGTGDTYIIKSGWKKWDWTKIFFSTAHAAPDLGNALPMLDPNVMPPNLLNISNVSFTGGTVQPKWVLPSSVLTTIPNSFIPVNLPGTDYMSASCSALPGGAVIAPDPSLNGKTCSISLAPGNAANPTDESAVSTLSAPQDLIQIPNCDPAVAGLQFYNENGDFKQKRLAVYSKNVLWLVNVNEKRIDKKIAYWQGSSVSKVQYVANPSSIFTMLVNPPDRPDQPHFAVNHECWDIYHPTLFKGIKEVGGLAVMGSSIVMSVTYSNESCVLVGSWGVEIPYVYKVAESCQAAPLTNVTFLATRYAQGSQGQVYCGLNFAVLRPESKHVVYHFIREPMISSYPAWAQPACTAATEVKPISIPMSNNLQSMSYNGSDMLAVLDTVEDSSFLHSLRVEPSSQYPEKYTVTYETRVALEGQGGATQVIWSPALGNFITNLSPTEGTLSQVPLTRMRRSTISTTTTTDLDNLGVTPSPTEGSAPAYEIYRDGE